MLVWNAMALVRWRWTSYCMNIQLLSAMNAFLKPALLLPRNPESPQPQLPLATEGIQRYVWESKYGPILIEVADGFAYVNGQRVEPADPADENRSQLST
jgi:hypothetical protein